MVTNNTENLYQPKLKMDDLKTDWISIFKTQSHSKETENMMIEIVRQISQIPEVVYTTDDFGNLYVVKGKSETYPIFVCHTDTVHKIYEEEPILFRSPNGNLALFLEPGGTEFGQIGIGGDDKCGIIACIEMLHRRKVVKCAFFLDEEIGCQGSAAGDLSFFDDGRFAIQVDRKNNCDIITTGSGTELCGDDFKAHISKIGEVYGYAPTTGFSTDVVKLKDRGLKLACVNLSAGYHNPHTKQEYVNERDFLGCLELCLAMANFKTVFTHEPKVREWPKSYTVNDRRSHASQYVGNRENVARKNAKHRRCLDCGNPLASTDGLLCYKCMETSFAASFVAINEDGDNVLYLQDFPKLQGDQFTPWLPSDNCLLCVMAKLTAEQRELGYCAACAHCTTCGNKLKTQVELLETVCPDCEHDAPIQVCGTSGCGTALRTQNEIISQTCKRCTDETVVPGVCGI